MTLILDDLTRWKQANEPRAFSLFDYVHAFFTGNTHHADAVIAISRIFWPEFCRYDNCIFLSERFSVAKYTELHSTLRSQREVEYWMNLVSIDGLIDSLEGLSDAHLTEFANQLAHCWRAKLRQEFPAIQYEVVVTRDEDGGDVALTICSVGPPT